MEGDLWGWAEVGAAADKFYYAVLNETIFETIGPNTHTSAIRSFDPDTQAAADVATFGTFQGYFGGTNTTGYFLSLECWGEGKNSIVCIKSDHATGILSLVQMDTSDPDPTNWDLILGGYTVTNPTHVKYVPNAHQFAFIESGVMYLVNSDTFALDATITAASLEFGGVSINSYAYSRDGRWLAILYTTGSAIKVKVFDRSNSSVVLTLSTPTYTSISTNDFAFSEDGFYFYFIGIGPSGAGTYVFRSSDWTLDIFYPPYDVRGDGQIMLNKQLLSPDNRFWYAGYSSFFFDDSRGFIWDFDGNFVANISGGNSQHQPDAINADYTQSGEFLIVEDTGTDTSGGFNSINLDTLTATTGGGKYGHARWRPFR